MRQLREAMATPHRMADFATAGVGVRAILKRFSRDRDFAGCYVLIKDRKPAYVGISKKVVDRLRQHVLGTTDNAASLAYRIAKGRSPHALTRKGAMAEVAFQRTFNDARSEIRGLDVAFVAVDNPLVLYVFEAFAAMELDTCEWNTFETH